MAQEIERKFLLRDDSWRSQADGGVSFRQGYLTTSGPASVRVRIEGDHANINIKSATLGVSRLEFEYPVPLADAEQLLKLCAGPIVEKRRHHVVHGRHTWEVDVFEGRNAGLVVAEIELTDQDEDFELPPWVGREVSDDPRYYNVSLATHPYCEWPREMAD